MDLTKFADHLKEINFDKERMGKAIDLVKEFVNFLDERNIVPENCSYEDFYSFSEKMITDNTNEYDNFIHILRFAKLIDNKDLIIAITEIVDGAEMIENFSERLERRYGKLIRDTVFWEIDIPPIGIHPRKRPAITMTLIDRLIENLGEKPAIKFLNEGLRDRYTDWYRMARETYLEAGSIDKFLDIKKQDFQHTLKKHMEEKSLFFTQEIDEEVINYVETQPMIESGIRKGNTLSVSKIPYMTKQFLEAKKNNDKEKMKYYYCHNPWLREGILDDNVDVKPICCQISCGYYKDYWEGVLETTVQVEITNSVLLGDDACVFNVHLPEEIK